MSELTNVLALPRYRCHKIVHAARILAIDETGTKLHLDMVGILEVPTDFLVRHHPRVDGYFVRYEDGYESYSPAAVFEAGYTLIEPAHFESPEPLLQFFAYAHLPAHLQHVSVPFHDLAHRIASDLPRNPERTVALRKLLEAKDCAVRALIWTT